MENTFSDTAAPIAYKIGIHDPPRRDARRDDGAPRRERRAHQTTVRSEEQRAQVDAEVGAKDERRRCIAAVAVAVAAAVATATATATATVGTRHALCVCSRSLGG